METETTNNENSVYPHTGTTVILIMKRDGICTRFLHH